MFRLCLMILFSLPIVAEAQQLVKYRYWYDQNFAARQTVNSTNEIIDLSLNVSSLTVGFHELHFQSQDAKSLWSPVSTSYFLKSNNLNSLNAKYRYWLDNNFSNAVQATNSDSIINLSLNIAVFSQGFHELNFQSQDVNGLWSPVNTSYFIKSKNLNSLNAKYRYWLDNNFANAVQVTNSDSIINLSLNIAGLSQGFHELNFQSQDANGLWSSISTTNFSHTNYGSSGITAYRYWYDSKFDSSQTIASTDTVVNLFFNVNNLSQGFHELNIQWKDVSGKWSSVVTNYFYVNTNAKNKLEAFRYWFDERPDKAVTIAIGNNNSTIYTPSINTDNLPNGQHNINYQFRDILGLWSSIIVDTFNKTASGAVAFVYPSISSNLSTTNAGNAIFIKGYNFIPVGQIKISLLNNGLGINNDTTITADNNGKFSFTYIGNASLPTGEYYLSALDKTTLFNSNSVRLKINGTVAVASGEDLYIAEPKGQNTYKKDVAMNITWGDFGSGKLKPSGASAKASVLYKIEYRTNSKSWKTFNIVTKDVYVGLTNAFSINFTPDTTAYYQFRVSRLNELTRNDTSDNVYVGNILTDVSVNYQWDSSGNKSNIPPLGVTADGTARFYIKIFKRNANTRQINNVNISLSDDMVTEARLLGKVLPATITHGYTTEANDANTTSVDRSTPNIDGAYWFWYVAPDDFSRNAKDNLAAERTVWAKFTITYSTGPPETIQSFIKIIRPPLMLVHGLGGDQTTWDNFEFSKNNTHLQYINEKGILYKFPVRVNAMDKSGSFISNAKTLLNLNTLGNPGMNQLSLNINSFQSLIGIYRRNGYACNRLDYVGHSMGGSDARTAVNVFGKYYNPSVNEKVLFKNYNKGFINKFITLNTPHNGSPFADLITDNYNSMIIQAGLQGAGILETYNESMISSLFVYDFNNSTYSLVPNIYPTSAVNDLRSVFNGIRFKETSIKNHLIGGDMNIYSSDCNYKIKQLIQNVQFTSPKWLDGIQSILKVYKLYTEVKKNGLLGVLTDKLISAPVGFVTNILGDFDKKIWTENFVNGLCIGIDEVMQQYGYPNFINSSDLVVPLSSQLPGINLTATLPDYATLIHGTESMHTNITSSLAAGNKVLSLLNAPINSSYFNDKIAANPNQGSGTSYRPISTADSVKEVLDTSKIKILIPISVNDSLLSFQINLKDSINLLKITGIFQGQIFNSFSKTFNQTFNLTYNKQIIGTHKLTVFATYDSSGYIIQHIDTASIYFPFTEVINRILVEPKKVDLGIGQTVITNVLAVSSSQYTLIPPFDNAISIDVADTNVVKYNVSTKQFTAKDSGTTYAVINYYNLRDTIFFIVSTSSIEVNSICKGNSTYFASDALGSSYQWQVDTGNGFINLSDDIFYNGSNSDVLNLTSVSTSWYGYKYRCLVSDGNSNYYSSNSLLKFSTIWTGGADTTWENPSNWSCGIIPDSNTDVIVNFGSLNYPIISSNAFCRSLLLSSGAIIKVKTGYNLNITGK